MDDEKKVLEKELNRISGIIVDAAIKVHRVLGPGLLESAYEACLQYELKKRGLDAQRQVPCPLRFEEVYVEVGYRIDLLVEEKVVVENKCSQDGFHPIHKAQLLSHLRLSNRKLGLLLNFHVPVMKDGILRMVNNL